MNGIILSAVVALSIAPQATDTLVPLDGASLLSVETMGGEVMVDVWDRDAVRIQADHSRRTFLEIEHRRSRIAISPEAHRGPASSVDFHITVPRHLDVKIEGFMVSITVEGTEGAVEAETLDGDVTIRGGRGRIKVSSMAGTVVVEGASGDIEVESAAGDVRIRDSSGDIAGETMAGSLVMQNVDARSVDVGTVGGHIWYDGAFHPDGTYFFGTHGGGVTLVVPENASAMFEVSTIAGAVHQNLRGEMVRSHGGERSRIEVGGGDAVVEVETFGGTIELLRKGTEGEPPEGHHGSMGDLHDMYGDLYDDLYDGVYDGLYDGVYDGLDDVAGLAVLGSLEGLRALEGLEGLGEAISAGLAAAFRGLEEIR